MSGYDSHLEGCDVARGGKRPGAGRPKRNEARVEVRLSKDELAVVDAYVERHQLASRAEAFRHVVPLMRPRK